MAVYTSVDRETLEAFLARYDLGALEGFEGIGKGVSNTNYHVFTDQGRYVLTILEPHRTHANDLPFFLSYADFLNQHDVLCPQALTARDGRNIFSIAGKPAILIQYLEGQDIAPSDITAAHCADLGAFVAKMHVVGAGFDQSRSNSFSQQSWGARFEKISAHVDTWQTGTSDLIVGSLAVLDGSWPSGLPSGAVHTDLFPDNVFFKNDRMHAVIDMYFACTEMFVFDLAIVINAWCFDAHNKIDVEKLCALMQAYEAVRPLSEDERTALPVVCQGTALRYFLSRLEEFLQHDPETMLMSPHDPQEYHDKLIFHKEKDIRDVIRS